MGWDLDKTWDKIKSPVKKAGLVGGGGLLGSAIGMGPFGAILGGAKGAEAAGISGNNPASIQDNYAKGMSSGIAQGRELLADPNLTESRAGLKEALKRTGPSQDEINQRASRAVANQRYQGNPQSSALQRKEMTRAVTSDLAKDKYKQDMAKAAGAYNLDLGEMKFAGGMGMAGAASQVAQTERKQGILEGTLDTLGLGGII